MYTVELHPQTFDGQGYVAPTWEQFGQLCFNLSEKIFQEVGDPAKHYDLIVALAHGGLTMARMMKDILGIEEMSYLRVKTYEGIGKVGEPVIVQSLPKEIEVKGKRILGVDDVWDTGKTGRATIKYFTDPELGVEKIDFATVFFKPKNVKSEKDPTPQYSACNTDDWIVFPHERREFVEETAPNWRGMGLDDQAILERYTLLGLPLEEMQAYLERLKTPVLAK